MGWDSTSTIDLLQNSFLLLSYLNVHCLLPVHVYWLNIGTDVFLIRDFSDVWKNSAQDRSVDRTIHWAVDVVIVLSVSISNASKLVLVGRQDGRSDL
mmetsp:Transcript_15466/g.15062  ORF Transcript_15466/g.15062 Transcript_15466/m.15062 type:complete len:97 (-) Transcript_15466:961-1251(-)